MTKIHILFSAKDVCNAPSVKYLCNREDIMIHICGRDTHIVKNLPKARKYNKLDASQMVNLIGSVDYYFGSFYRNEIDMEGFTSGFLPLAIILFMSSRVTDIFVLHFKHDK